MTNTHRGHRERAPLEDQIADLIGLGHRLYEQGRSCHLGGSGTIVGRVARILERLPERRVLDSRDDGGLEALGDILERDLASEVTGQREEPTAPYLGPSGEIERTRLVPVYSERGRQLLLVRQTLQDYVGLRRTVLDRIEALRLVQSLLLQ